MYFTNFDSIAFVQGFHNLEEYDGPVIYVVVFWLVCVCGKLTVLGMLWIVLFDKHLSERSNRIWKVGRGHRKRTLATIRTRLCDGLSRFTGTFPTRFANSEVLHSSR